MLYRQGVTRPLYLTQEAPMHSLPNALKRGPALYLQDKPWKPLLSIPDCWPRHRWRAGLGSMLCRFCRLRHSDAPVTLSLFSTLWVPHRRANSRLPGKVRLTLTLSLAILFSTLPAIHIRGSTPFQGGRDFLFIDRSWWNLHSICKFEF